MTERSYNGEKGRFSSKRKAEAPDQMWGTDATATRTARERQVTIFPVIDHRTDECLGLHAAIPATRLKALEPVRQGAARNLRRLSRPYRRWADPAS